MESNAFVSGIVKDRFYKARNKTSLDRGGEKKMSLVFSVHFGSSLWGM